MSSLIKDHSAVNNIMFMPSAAGTYDFNPAHHFVITDDDHNVICCSLISPTGRYVSQSDLLRNHRLPFFIFCHGNACNLQQVVADPAKSKYVECYTLSFDYIGYGQSGNTHRGFNANENSACLSMRLVLHHVINNMRVPIENIVLHGQSIGSGVAAYGARYVVETYQKNVGGLILVSPYLSIRDLAQDMTSVGSLILQRLNTQDNISYCKCPLFVIHGECDDVIPVEHGRQLFNSATCEKYSYFPSGATHNYFNMDELSGEIIHFLTTYVEGKMVNDVDSYVNITPRVHPGPLYQSYTFPRIVQTSLATTAEMGTGSVEYTSGGCLIL